MKIEITQRVRQYGYFIWKKSQDEKMINLLGDGRAKVHLIFDNAILGEKNVDWKNRRISIGWRWTRALPEAKKYFVVSFQKPNTLEIKCR